MCHRVLSCLCPVILILGASMMALAQVPQLINCQAALLKPNGQPDVNATRSVRFAIYDAPAGSTEQWSETQMITTDNQGRFDVLLGVVNPINASVFTGPDRWLGIAVENDPEMIPRAQLVSTPYSHHAQSVANNAITSDGIQDGTILFNDIAQNGASSGQVMKWDVDRWVAANDEVGSGNGWVDDGTVVRLQTGTDSVGIGTNSPSRKLEVNGTLLVTGSATIGVGHVNTGGGTFIVGQDNTVTVDLCTISGGSYNSISGGKWNVIGGGAGNTLDQYYSTISGGRGNEATGGYSTIGGGGYNKARGEYSVVCGGGGAWDSDSNLAYGDYSAIGGGDRNQANVEAAVGGGVGNIASGGKSAIAGGAGNTASGPLSSIGGGQFNEATVEHTTVSGGIYNHSTGSEATVGGGQGNTASGEKSTVPGGWRNAARGAYSFAAGYNAKAAHKGSVVITASFSGAVDDTVQSGCDGQMVFRADGNFYMTNGGGLVAPCVTGRFLNTSTGAYLSTAGQWTDACDRNLKRNFQPVDNEDLLARIAELPINRWSYKVDDETVTHIGPVAQDFYGQFGVGNDDKTIAPGDQAGIALAAIQGLYQQNQEQQQENVDLKRRIEQLEVLVRELLAKRQ